MVNRRLKLLVEDDREAWRLAGLKMLPRAWAALLSPGVRFDVASREARLFLKYCHLHERSCYQALQSAEFRPYCLKITGVSLSSLAKALPEARLPALPSLQSTSVNNGTADSPPRPGLSPHSAPASLSAASGAALALSPQLPGQADASLPSRAENPIPSTLSQVMEQDTNQDDALASSELASTEEPNLFERSLRPGFGAVPATAGGEVVVAEDVEPNIAIPEVAATQKRHNPIYRGFSKIKQVVGFVQKVGKTTSNLVDDTIRTNAPSSNKRNTSARKRDIKFDDHDHQQGHEGVDEAWLHLPHPTRFLFRGNKPAPTVWRVMSELNLLVSVMTIYSQNPNVITVGACIVRRLCYGNGKETDEVSSIRGRVANTPIADVLLNALQEFRKDNAVVATILVALGNLALASAAACTIGDRGLPLIVRVMKRHRENARVMEYGLFLLLNVADTRVEYKKKLRDLEFPIFLVRELSHFFASVRTSSSSSSVPTSQNNVANPAGKSSSKSSAKDPHKSSSELKAALAPLVQAHHDAELRRVMAGGFPTSSSSNLQSTLAAPSEGSLGDSAPRISRSDEVAEAAEDATEDGMDPTWNEDAHSADQEEMPPHEGPAGEVLTQLDLNEKMSAWIMKKRPSFAVLERELAAHGTELVKIRRMLDILCILGSDYDILRQDTALKIVTVVGDAIVTLFGCPLPNLDGVLAAAFRCLLVVFEWDVHNQDKTYSTQLAASLMLLSNFFVKARVELPYMANCYLVIFSIIWMRRDLEIAQRKLIELIVASLKFSSAPATSPVLVPGAAMLSDFASSSYDLRTHISDIGGIQVLRQIRNELQEGNILTRLDQILDEFEDNPLLRRNHQPAQQDVGAAEQDADQGEASDDEED